MNEDSKLFLNQENAKYYVGNREIELKNLGEIDF